MIPKRHGRTDRQTDRRTDGRTDRRLTVASLRSALASRGKNESCDILVPNELKNAEHLTVRLGLQ